MGKLFGKWLKKEYIKIGDVDALTARANATEKSGKTFNFSKETYEKLLSLISDFERIRFQDTEAWNAYSTEEWYEELFIKDSIVKSKYSGCRKVLSTIGRIARINMEKIWEKG